MGMKDEEVENDYEVLKNSSEKKRDCIKLVIIINARRHMPLILMVNMGTMK